MIRNLLVMTLLAFGLGAAPVAQYSAQAVPSDTNTSPTALAIVAVNQLTGARMRLYVRVGNIPEIVIAVPSGSATEADLAEAFDFAVRAHKRMLDLTAAYPKGTILKLNVNQARPGRQLGVDEARAYRRYLNSLSNAPEMQLPGIGTGRVIRVAIPDWQ